MANTYKVRFVKAGRTVQVEEGRSVLKAAVGSGLDLEFLCTDGNCGTCKAKLLEGEISYRREPEILYDDEKADGIVLLCIASPKTDLVVEEL